MRTKDQTMLGDGFDKNVAEKMPKMKKIEEPSPLIPVIPEDEWEPPADVVREIVPEAKPPEKAPPERKIIFQTPREAKTAEPSLDILKLVEDLHAQVLASNRAKRAAEMDLVSSQRTIHQLAQDNKELRAQLEEMRRDLQKLKEIQGESMYLKEENEDALERIRELQEQLRNLGGTLTALTRERDEARERTRGLESQAEQGEVFRIRERMKEREASQFHDENREIRARFEEVYAQKEEVERKYEALRKSFDEVKESLSFLRESCKASFYNLSENPE